MKKNVIIGLSGGVDSAVAGYLLKQAGYCVQAVFMVNWKERGSCHWEDDLASSRSVAKHLSIPLTIWDFAKEYREFVFKDFIALYKKGMTPNPDVFCNKYIKFGAFYRRARKEGADFVATGHYARIVQSPKVHKVESNTAFSLRGLAKQSHFSHLTMGLPRGLATARNDSEYYLHSATDKTKDQSDFLYQIKQSQLKHILFPIGGMLKTDVKTLAKKIGLPNWNRPESMGVCFIGEMNMKRFLHKYIPSETGAIVDTGGNEMGTHDGAWYYTIGQREGLSIGGTGPYFVVKKDVKRNVLVVAKEPEAEKFLMVRKVVMTRVNLFIGRGTIYYAPPESTEVLWRDRHLSPLQKGILRQAQGDNHQWIVEFSKPKRAVAPGQSLVLYDLRGEKVIGGGVIARAV